MRGSLNWSGNQLREERNKRKKRNDIIYGLNFPLIDIDGIRHRLESVKTDTHGKNHLKRPWVHPNAKGLQQLRSRVDEKVTVFKKSK